MQDTYNGWSTYETQVCATWLIGLEPLNDNCVLIAREATSLEHLEFMLREFVFGIRTNPDTSRAFKRMLDEVGSLLQVDFQQLALHFAPHMPHIQTVKRG